MPVHDHFLNRTEGLTVSNALHKCTNCNEQVNNMHPLDYIKTKKGHKSNLNKSTNTRLASRWQQKKTINPHMALLMAANVLFGISIMVYT